MPIRKQAHLLHVIPKGVGIFEQLLAEHGDEGPALNSPVLPGYLFIPARRSGMFSVGWMITQAVRTFSTRIGRWSRIFSSEYNSDADATIHNDTACAASR